MPGTRYRLPIVWIALTLLIAGCATVPTEYHEPASLGAADRAALNTRIFDRTWELVNQKYFDATFHGVDWSALRAKYRSETIAAPDEESLYRVLNRLCAELKESHLRAYTPRQVHYGHFAKKADVGMKWSWLDGHAVVSEIAPEGAAATAGVHLGWFVVSRDGTPITETLSFFSNPDVPETYVFLDEQDRSHTFALTPRLSKRDIYRPESRELPGGFRYLRFGSFNFGMFSWLSREIKANRSAPGFIVDLRHNPGGHGNSLAIMLGQFFPQRIDFGRFTNRDGEPTEKSGSSLFFASYHGPLVVLTDGSTASAAEIFAHVVQYHKRATIVGRRTAGWVLLSFDYALPDGGRLVIPEQDYLGLDGQRLEGRGVTPDVVVPVSSLADLRAGRDPDLEAALNVLRQPDSDPGNKRRPESATRSIDPQLPPLP